MNNVDRRSSSLVLVVGLTNSTHAINVHMNSSVSPSLKMGEERFAKIRIQNIAGNDDVIMDGLTMNRRMGGGAL